MAHFAKIDENNTVIDVIVISNNDILDENGNESEEVGVLFCKSLFGEDTNWIQTSYSSKFRAKYAGIGDTWDDINNIFIPKKQYSSWVYNESLNVWESPIPYPEDKTKFWEWDDSTVSWKEILVPSE